MKLKAVIFDCFGVLTADSWKEFVATLPRDQVEPARALNYQADAGQISQADFLEQVAQLASRPLEVIKATLHGGDGKNLPLLSYISVLKNQYKIGLLSNVMSDWIRTDFLSAEELNLFDDMVMSFEVGVNKPSRRIFELSAERLDLAAAECLLVDDSELNCRAAEAAGMKSILYENFAQFRKELGQMIETD